MAIDIGIPEKNRTEIATELSRFLADTFTLYFMTHTFHWNVTGPQFHTLHDMFMQQYEEMWTATDEIAERIRSLGAMAPANQAAFRELTSVSEPDAIPSAQAMLQAALAGHEQVIRQGRKIVGMAAAVSDEATADLVTQRVQTHEKTAWMLRAMLSE